MGLLITAPGWPVERVAGACRVTRNTVYRWARWASRYPEAAPLLVGARAHRRPFIRDLAAAEGLG